MVTANTPRCQPDKKNLLCVSLTSAPPHMHQSDPLNECLDVSRQFSNCMEGTTIFDFQHPFLFNIWLIMPIRTCHARAVDQIHRICKQSARTFISAITTYNRLLWIKVRSCITRWISRLRKIYTQLLTWMTLTPAVDFQHDLCLRPRTFQERIR